MGLLSGRNLRARLTQPANEWWDRRLGVSTFGYHPEAGTFGTDSWTSCYVPVSYRDVFELLRAAGVNKDDVFVDIGSGLGRAVFAAAHLGAGRSIGVELIPQLAEAAERNRQRSRLSDKAISFVAADALKHPLGDTSLLYSFHSLGEPVLAELLAKLHADRRRQGRRQVLRFAYMNPVFEHVLANAGWLEPMADIAPHGEPLSSANHYRAVVWRSTDQ